MTRLPPLTDAGIIAGRADGPAAAAVVEVITQTGVITTRSTLGDTSV